MHAYPISRVVSNVESNRNASYCLIVNGVAFNIQKLKLVFW